MSWVVLFAVPLLGVGLSLTPAAAATRLPAPFALTGSPGTYSHWALPDVTGGYNRLSETITPNNDPVAGAGQAPPAWFYAMQWYNESNTTFGGYAGLQTDSGGKKAIFSWWGGITGRSTGISQAFSGEGSGWQTLIPFAWQAAHSYVLTVERTSVSPGGTWFAASLRDTAAGQTTKIGSIEIPTALGGIYAPWINNFVEWYAPHPAGCANYPRSDVTFTAPRGRDLPGHSTLTSVPAVPPSDTPAGPDCSQVVNQLTSMTHTNGT